MVQMVKDIVLKVPEGTVIKEAESGKVIADMSGEIIASGHLKKVVRAVLETSICNSYHAGSEVCTARTAGKRTHG